MTSYINFGLVKNAASYIVDYVKKKPIENIQILEPLSVIINLAIISFKEKKTKIAIYNNKIYIQEPNMWQGPVRYAYGNNREEISLLLKPIMRSIELYPADSNIMLEYIYERAVEGLKKLKTSYDKSTSTLCHSLDLYISILESNLTGKSLSIHTYDQSKNLSELNLSTQTRVNIQNIFSNIWDENDIILLHSMLKSAEKSNDVSGMNVNNYLDSISNLLDSKEPIISDRIKKAKHII